jgi:hypothetical protein
MLFKSIMFRERLYNSTKESHKEVDRHKFVNLIRNKKNAGEMYINMNKICIKYIQNEIQRRLEDDRSEWEPFRSLFSKLYKDIKVDCDISSNMNKLLNRCKEHPLEHGYMFILGLLFGGKLLSTYLPDHIDFLTYNNRNELINEFKDYLDKHVVNETEFINIVNDSYKLISEIFDEFYINIERWVGEF